MTTDIVKYQEQNFLPTEHEIAVMQTMAKSAYGSSFFKRVGGLEGVLTVMLAARELGIPPMQALMGGIHIIEGRPEISARLIGLKIRQAGHAMKIIEANTKKCVIYGKRSDTGEEWTETYEIEEARVAGKIKPDSNWLKVPGDMCFARCISRLGRRLFPDVIMNAYVEGEVEREETPEIDLNQDQPQEAAVEAETVTEPPLEIPEESKDAEPPSQSANLDPKDCPVTAETVNRIKALLEKIKETFPEKVCIDYANDIKKYLKQKKVARVSELSEQQAIALIDLINTSRAEPDPAEVKDDLGASQEPSLPKHTDEWVKLNKTFWQVIDNHELSKYEDQIKQYCYRLMGVKTMAALTFKQYSIFFEHIMEFINDDERQKLISVLTTIVGP